MEVLSKLNCRSPNTTNTSKSPKPSKETSKQIKENYSFSFNPKKIQLKLLSHKQSHFSFLFCPKCASKFLLKTLPMLMKHRKLFPDETATNQTQDCYGFCDPLCPYNCYSNQNYYLPPPPPFGRENHIPSYLIILVSIFTVIFVLVGFYVIKLKCYADWCGPRRVNNSVPSQNSEEFLNENQVEHPVWLIATIGLQQSVINSITVCKYRKEEGLIEGTECSVCLNEFREDETLRLLPKCNHAFHIPCIDTWLRSHTNCPLCRAGIVIVTNNVAPESAMSNFASLEHEDANLGRNQETQMENSQNEGGLSNNFASPVVSENRGGTGESSEALDESNSKDPDPPQNQMALTNLIEVNSVSTEHERHHNVDHIQDETELNRVNLLLKQDGDHSETCRTGTMRRSSIEECLHISPVSMKRSFSWNGRILSRRGYMSLNSTLPY